MSDPMSLLVGIGVDDADFRKGMLNVDRITAQVTAKIDKAMKAIDKETMRAFRSAEVESRRLQSALNSMYTNEQVAKARETAAAAVAVAKANRDGAQVAVAAARAAEQGTGSYDRQRAALAILTQANRAYQAAVEAEKSTVTANARITQEAAAEVDRLRLKYVPLEQVTREYQASVADLNRAQAAGALSTEEFQAALARINTQFTRQTRDLGQGETRWRNLGQTVQQTGYQIGDFAVQVASGQSPLRAFIQQGAQVAGAFGPWGAAIGAAGAVAGALVTTLFDTADAEAAVSSAAGTSATAMDAYRETLEQVDVASRDLKASTRDLEASVEDVGLAAVQAALQVEEQLQESLAKQIEEQRRLLSAMSSNADVQSPEDLMRVADLEAAIGALIEKFDRSADRSDNLFNRLTILRDVIPEVTRETRLAAAAQAELGRAIESATEAAEEDRRAREAASTRAKALIKDRDDFLMSVDREILQTAQLTAALKSGSREYAVVAKQHEILNENTLIGAAAARKLAEAIVDSERAFDRQRKAIEAANDAVAQATELAVEQEEARRAASERAGELLGDRDAYLASIEREIAQNLKLSAAVLQSQEAYELAAKTLDVMNGNVLVGADEAGRLAKRLLESEAAIKKVTDATEAPQPQYRLGAQLDAIEQENAA